MRLLTSIWRQNYVFLFLQILAISCHFDHIKVDLADFIKLAVRFCEHSYSSLLLVEKVLSRPITVKHFNGYLTTSIFNRGRATNTIKRRRNKQWVKLTYDWENIRNEANHEEMIGKNTDRNILSKIFWNILHHYFRIIQKYSSYNLVNYCKTLSTLIYSNHVRLSGIFFLMISKIMIDSLDFLITISTINIDN